MRGWRAGAAATAIAVGTGLVAAAPAGAEERTIPDSSGDVSYFSPDGRSEGADRPAVDVVGTSVAYTDAGIRVEVFTRAPAPRGMVVTHLVHLELPGDGERHLVVFRSQQPEVDVITEGGGVSWRQGRCHAVARDEVGTRIMVVVPPACLPQLGPQTRFRLDSFLWEPPGTLSEQWWERVPADGGFSLFRGARPGAAPDPAADGPVYDRSGPEGSISRLYRVALGRVPDAGGLAHWLRQVWSGRPLLGVADDLARSPESAARFGIVPDDELVRLLYRHALGREPDPAGHRWWVDRLRAGASRGSVMLHVAESPELWARVAGDLPEGYRASA
jgi:hypothetical protein